MATALSIIFFAMATLSSAFLGIPSLSSARPITAAPYFLTIGRMLLSESSSPLTEFTIGFPLYILKAESRTSGIVESSCKGTSTTDCNDLTVSIIICLSSIPGSPTFTSSISAPAPVCSSACPNM